MKLRNAVIWILLIVSAGFLQSALVTTNIITSGDTYASSAAPASENGAKEHIWVRSWTNASSNPDSMKAYLKFVLPSDMVAGSITGAGLTFVRQGTAIGIDLTMNLYGLTLAQSWIEKGGGAGNNLTWNNAPANDTGSMWGFTSDAKLLASSLWVKGSEGEAVSIASSADWVAFLNTFDPGDTVTLMLAHDSPLDNAGVTRLASREHATLDAPTLTLEYTQIPEPATIGILGGGCILLLLARRSHKK
ncbi:MAG: PEP-CTERM sorting domain-containing protein [Kiritimatiellales bacterium]